jgi:hypothetical protein
MRLDHSCCADAPDGNRLLKAIGSTTTFFDYSGGNLLEEANATTGAAPLDYIYMDDRVGNAQV